jgi:acetyl-CoA C-acetyltransferase
VDFELAAIDLFHEGLLMAPASAIPRLLARHGLRYEDIALWEIHEAFAAQVLCHVKALDDPSFVRQKTGLEHRFGKFPIDRINPTGGSVALGHPFAATGARILSQAVKELATQRVGALGIVSICADGGQGSAALLQNAASPSRKRGVHGEQQEPSTVEEMSTLRSKQSKPDSGRSKPLWV